MSEYTHILIPGQRDLIPSLEQVFQFLRSLSLADALPLKPSITVGLQSGIARSGVNPITGELISYSRRVSKLVTSISELPNLLQGQSDYNITLSGNGPPKTPALHFDFDGPYQFLVKVCQRPLLVSTSDLHDPCLAGYDVPSFDSPCGPEHSRGVYQHPDTLAIILVPGAGCSRFRIEFEFGKSLVPNINDSLEILEPQIVSIASDHFGTSFLQGCSWSA